VTDRIFTATGSQLVVAPSASRAKHDWRLDRLIAHLPKGIQPIVRWLRLPSARWIRLPVGVLLIAGGLFSVLPLLGIWMLPLGVVLLAEDIPLLRRATDKGLDWIERHRPHWFNHPSR
jgi:hypothetical protein